MKFSRSHASMMIRYLGISFITGAIAHGFFSGTRSIIFGVLGIVLFTIGSLLEEGADKEDSWKVIMMGAMLALGIGAFTGGFQHFPDSPGRSVWILPLGFMISLIFYAQIHGYTWGKREYSYSLISALIVTVLSLSIYGFFQINPQYVGTDVGHSQSDSHDD